MSDISYKELIEIFEKEGTDGCFSLVKSKCTTECGDKAIKKSLDKIILEYKNLKKSKSKPSYPLKIQSFFENVYKFPTSVTGESVKMSETEQLCSTMGESSVATVASELQHLISVNKSLETENNLLKEKLKVRLLRRDRYQKTVDEKLALAKENNVLAKENKVLKSSLKTKNAILKQVRSSKSYTIVQLNKLKQEVEKLGTENADLKVSLEVKDQQLKELKSETSELNQSVDYLQLLLSNDEVELYNNEPKCYNKSFQTCVYELLTLNVSTSKVSPVIECVLKLANLRPNKLPCLTTVNNMNIQRLILAQKQLSDTLADKPRT
ncbi:hypothetical protein KUTeg_013796 [Tegillarca granosa]|uniref:Uncharacterized protein n=1 Tax=Tegillarca granosa TaxID=220873 RepID=A0ABQ9EZ79_TEGGR|nr:hypothetical protein KUTeg_013796 [Tegillarca granosa]